MGTKAKHMDCDGMIQKASQLANKGNDMQNAIKEAFSRIERMRDGDAWTGSTYDQLVEIANFAKEKMNKIIKNVVSIIPHDIATNAQGIASAGNVTPSVSYRDQTPIVLSDMSATNKGVVWDFDEDVTNANKQAIKSKFDEAKSCMAECQNIADNLLESMNSGNGAAKTRELKSAYKILEAQIDNLSRAVDNQIQAQALLFNATEAAMAAKDKITDAAKDTMDDIVESAGNIKDKAEQTVSDIKSFFIY